jgi:hypothetical protein
MLIPFTLDDFFQAFPKSLKTRHRDPVDGERLVDVFTQQLWSHFFPKDFGEFALQ